MVYSAARVVLTKDHKLGDSSNRNLLSLSPGGEKCEISESAMKEASVVSFSRRLVVVSSRSHAVLSVVYLSTVSPFYKDIRHMGLGHILLTSCNVITSIKTLFPNKVTS